MQPSETGKKPLVARLTAKGAGAAVECICSQPDALLVLRVNVCWQGGVSLLGCQELCFFFSLYLNY